MMRLILLVSAIFMGLSGSAQLGYTAAFPEDFEGLFRAPYATAFGEFSSAAEAYTEVNRLIIEESWTEAESLLALLMEEDQENRNFAYKRALCLRSIKGRLGEAVPFVHQSIDGEFTKRYNAFDVNASVPPSEALDLALDVLQFTGHFAEAQAVAMTIMGRYPRRDFRHIRAKQAIQDCAFAMDCLENPLAMDIFPEEALNSSSADYAPVITPDGNVVYFTSYRDDSKRSGRGRGRIFRSLKTEDGWGNPIALEVGDPNRDMTTVALIGDEEALIVYQSYRNAGSLWRLNRDTVGGWMVDDKVGFPVDSRHWETSLTERFDGKERIFVSDRPGGMGGRDLYRSVYLPDGTWSEPLNLGRRINSSGEEESPVVSADGRVLMFASNGHQGMGGFDLFRCIRLDNGSWSDPEHMGAPLNTPGDEAMVTLDASGQTGYVSSARAGGDDMDIYRVELREEPKEALAVFIGDIANWENGDVLEVRSVDDGPAIFRVFRARSESGSFVAALPPCREYRFNWMRRSETLATTLQFVDCDVAYGNEKQVQRLQPFGLNIVIPVTNDEDPASEDWVYNQGAQEIEVEMEQSAILEEALAPSHSFDDPNVGDSKLRVSETNRQEVQSGDEQVTDAVVRSHVELETESIAEEAASPEEVEVASEVTADVVVVEESLEEEAETVEDVEVASEVTADVVVVEESLEEEAETVEDVEVASEVTADVVVVEESLEEEAASPEEVEVASEVTADVVVVEESLEEEVETVEDIEVASEVTADVVVVEESLEEEAETVEDIEVASEVTADVVVVEESLEEEAETVEEVEVASEVTADVVVVEESLEEEAASPEEVQVASEVTADVVVVKESLVEEAETVEEVEVASEVTADVVVVEESLVEEAETVEDIESASKEPAPLSVAGVAVSESEEALAKLVVETPLTMVEFEAVSTVVEFGYGRYMTESRSSEVGTMVSEIAARCALGEVPVLQIEGSASFVPVKNKRAYESNEELARMRAEKARDAMITAMSAKGLQIGVDYQIVLDWKVAGPEFKGDAISAQQTYRNYQFAKFSLGRQLVEKRR